MQICIGVRSKQMQFIIGFCQTLKNRGVIFEVDFEGGFHFLRVLHIKMQNVANLPPVDWGLALSELQTTKRLICSKTNAGNSLKADNPAKTKAELSKISRLQYIV